MFGTLVRQMKSLWRQKIREKLYIESFSFYGEINTSERENDRQVVSN